MTAPVTAAVVNYNAKAYLLECIASLRREDVAEVVVADNGSIDGSEAAVRAADAEVTYVRTGANLGYGTGVNRAVARSDGAQPFLLCLNADARVEPGAVEAMLAAFEDRPEVGDRRAADRRRPWRPLPVGPDVPEHGRRRRPRLPRHGLGPEPVHPPLPDARLGPRGARRRGLGVRAAAS